MKTKGVLAILLVIGFLSALTFEAKAESPTLAATRITANPAIQGSPDVSENTIVWRDNRNGNADIYAYDLSSRTETQITTASTDQRNPAVSGSIIVWEDDRNGNWDIYSYNLSSKNETRITTNNASQTYPDVDGDLIVWDDYRNGTDDIYGYNLSSRTEFQITTNPLSQASMLPKASGNIVVWQDNRNGLYNPSIVAYNLSSKTEIPITTDIGDDEAPAVSGNIIVWRDAEHDIVYAYDLSTEVKTQISTNSSKPSDPDVSGNIVVWDNITDGGNNIRVYDLLTKTETQIDANPADQREPAVSGNVVVWEDLRNGDYDIYSAYVPVSERADGQHVLSVGSNSTISQLSFNSSDRSLGFIATGPNGTRGYCNITLDKSLISELNKVIARVDGVQTVFSSNDLGDKWAISFDYGHSTHSIVVDLDVTVVSEFSSAPVFMLLVMGLFTLVFLVKKKTQTQLK